MLRLSLFIAAVAVLSFSPVANASIVGWDCNADTDGVISCQTCWTAASNTLQITGNQQYVPGYGVTGHVVGDFTTDTDQDPTVGMINYIDNDTGFTWTDYHVTVYMDKSFTVGSPAVLGPPGWTTVLGTPPLDGQTNGMFTDAHGNQWSNAATIDFYSTGNNVPVGNTLSFTYSLSFLGSVSYEQEMTPSPEPASLTLLALGGLGLLRRRS